MFSLQQAQQTRRIEMATRPRKAAATVTAPTGIVIEAGEIRLDVQPGCYRKHTTRIGRAFLEVGIDGSLGYTNRRRESRVVTAKEFLAIWKTGLTTKFA
jgi:hypothetical protein